MDPLIEEPERWSLRGGFDGTEEPDSDDDLPELVGGEREEQDDSGSEDEEQLPETRAYLQNIEPELTNKLMRMLTVGEGLRQIKFTKDRPRAPPGACPPAEERLSDKKKDHAFYPGSVLLKQRYKDQNTGEDTLRVTRSTMTRVTAVEDAPTPGREQVWGLVSRHSVTPKELPGKEKEGNTYLRGSFAFSNRLDDLELDEAEDEDMRLSFPLEIDWDADDAFAR
jgi:hypothetical protein